MRMKQNITPHSKRISLAGHSTGHHFFATPSSLTKSVLTLCLWYLISVLGWIYIPMDSIHYYVLLLCIFFWVIIILLALKQFVFPTPTLTISSTGFKFRTYSLNWTEITSLHMGFWDGNPVLFIEQKSVILMADMSFISIDGYDPSRTIWILLSTFSPNDRAKILELFQYYTKKKITTKPVKLKKYN